MSSFISSTTTTTLSAGGQSTSAYASIKKLYPSLSTLNLASTLVYSSDLHNPEAAQPLSTQNNTEPPPEFAFDLPKRYLVLEKLFTTKKVQPIGSATGDSSVKNEGQQHTDTLEAFFANATQNSANAIKPVQLLIERLESCQQLSKHLLDYFKMLANMEQQVSKVYHNASGATAVLSDTSTIASSSRNSSIHPSEWKRKTASLVSNALKSNASNSSASHASDAGGGVNNIIEAWQHYHNKASQDHVQFATYLKHHAIPTFESINREFKWMIKCICKDDRLSLKTLTKLKYEAAKRMKALNQQLMFFEEHPYHGHTRQDPWLMNAGVVDQLVKVYRQENKIHETVLRVQQETWASEQHFIAEFQRLTQQLHALRQDNGLNYITELWNSSHMPTKTSKEDANDQESNEEKADIAPHYSIISEKASFRHPDQIQLTHPLLQPVLATRMDGKSRALFENRWLDCIYVLTAAGFLHEFKRSENYPANPDATIYVPHYTVVIISTFTNPHHQSLMFQLQPKMVSAKPAMSNSALLLNKQWKSATKSRRNHQYQDRKTWTLRAKSVKEMEEWVASLRKHSEKIFTHVTVPPSVSNDNDDSGSAFCEEVNEEEVEEDNKVSTLKEDVDNFKEEDILKNEWVTSTESKDVADESREDGGDEATETKDEADSSQKESENKWVHTAEVTMTGWD